MFERMIRAADTAVELDTVSIVNGEPLPDLGVLQAILITGSPAGVYNEFGWIAPLEDFVRRAYAGKNADARVRQNLALVVGMQGRFSEAEGIVKADLPADEAAANVAYLKEMLSSHKDNPRLGAAPGEALGHS